MNDEPKTAVGILIVLVTIFGAYVTWRAADAAGAAADYDRQGRQSGVLKDQLRAQHRSVVSYELQLYRLFDQHVRTADRLEQQAAKSRSVDAALSEPLQNEAELHRGIARALQNPFAYFPVNGYAGDPESRPAYAPRSVLRQELRDDPELQELQPRVLRQAADAAREKRLRLVEVDTAVIFSIFFLTLALLAARRQPLYAVVGSRCSP